MINEKEWWEDGWNEQFFVLDNEHSCCFRIKDEREEERKRIAEAARRSRIETIEEVIETVSRKKLWSKGTVEGTRQDILFALSKLKE